MSKVLRASDCALKNVAQGIAAQRRAFTSSSISQRHGGVPKFAESSSPELDSLLSAFRTKVFLPAYLSKQQQALIYGSKHKKMLLSEPITAELGGEEFQLEHIDRLKDVPNTVRGLLTALDLMQERRDWDNLPLLLEGLNKAGRKLRQPYYSKIVRKAGQAGRLDVILECARKVSDTNFTLRDVDLVSDFMWWIQQQALMSDWKVRQTRKALSWAEMVAVMLEDPRHSGGRVLSGVSDARAAPEVIGVLLQLAAVRAAKHFGGKDQEGKVAKYTERLLGTSLDVKARSLDAESPQTVHEMNQYILAVSPVLHGMRVAQTVLDPSSKLSQNLKAKTVELEQTVLASSQSLRENWKDEDYAPSGLVIYDKLLGAASS